MGFQKPGPGWSPCGYYCKVEPGPPPSVRRETWDRTGIGVLELSSELWRIARCELPSKPRVYTTILSARETEHPVSLSHYMIECVASRTACLLLGSLRLLFSLSGAFGWWSISLLFCYVNLKRAYKTYAGGGGGRADVRFFQILKITITLFQQKPSFSNKIFIHSLSTPEIKLCIWHVYLYYFPVCPTMLDHQCWSRFSGYKKL